MGKKLFAGLLLLATFLLLGCGQELTDEQIEERNAKSRATIAERAYQMRRDADVKSGGNWIAKRIGGSAHVTLPSKHKLVTLTWKQDDMWILYRPFREGEKAEYYIYREDSKFGLIEGTVIIKECE